MPEEVIKYFIPERFENHASTSIFGSHCCANDSTGIN